MDRGQSESLAGMDREPGVGVPHVLEGVQMTGRRISGLGAGDVEPDGTPVAELHGQLGDLP